MVDSRTGEAVNGPEHLPRRVERIEDKLDALAASADARFEQVDRRFEQVDRRFDEVTDALVEQRRYTEAAYERLDAKIDATREALSAQIALKLDAREAKAHFARLERKIDQLLDITIARLGRHPNE
ncbi:MAG TPA: hypothetical protein VM364_05590 [Vicinamibacterales bacterium]|nr:hypothetical protein [Vicinamibacterales bacterium]